MSTTIDRTVWLYQKADWERMQQIFIDADWSFLHGGNPHNGAKQFHDIITQAAAECIPTETPHERKSPHPWLTKEVEELVVAKHAAQGTDGELKAAEACSEAILKEHRVFAQKSADEMQQLKPGNKAWWSKSKKMIRAQAAMHQHSGSEDRRWHMGIQSSWEGRDASRHIQEEISIDPVRAQQVHRFATPRPPTKPPKHTIRTGSSQHSSGVESR